MNLSQACKYELDSLPVQCELKPAIGIDSVVLINAEAAAAAMATTTPSGVWWADYTDIVAPFADSTVEGFGLVDRRATPFEGSQKTTEEGAVVPTTTKTLQFLYFVNSFKESAALEELKRGRFVVIVKYSGAGVIDEAHTVSAGQKFEVFGYETPMRVTACERTLAAADSNGANFGAYLVTLSCTELTDTRWFALASNTANSYEAELTAYNAIGGN